MVVAIGWELIGESVCEEHCCAEVEISFCAWDRVAEAVLNIS